MKILRSLRPRLLWPLAALFVSVLPSTAQATVAGHGPSPEIVAEQNTEKVEIARLRIQNTKGGIIEGSRDGGTNWDALGHVLQPVSKVNPKGYNASKYGPPATVVATAVNAIHLKAGDNTAEGRGIIWSLAPLAESPSARVSLQTEVNPSSGLFTDIPGGSGIFGGIYTPFVGNPISLDSNRDNVLRPLPAGYIPAVGDTWTIRIMRPRQYPREIVFENRFGGLITIEYRGQKPRVIGQVLRPVQGVGRFVGSYFSEVGRLRANHNGVIDISTSPRGDVGSFQIVPANHAMSPETHYIRELTQWMVIGPVSALDKSWEGTAPLFTDFLRPRYDPNDLEVSDVVEGMAGRFRFEVKKTGSNEWQPMPSFSLRADKPIPSWAGTCLANVTHIRIAFPFVWDDPAPPASGPSETGAPANAPSGNVAG